MRAQRGPLPRTPVTDHRATAAAHHYGGRVASTEFFTSFEDDEPRPTATGARLRSNVGSGPTAPLAATPGTGFTGSHALHYATTATGLARAGLFTVELAVTERTELSYVVLPESGRGVPTYRSTYVAVDVEFDDGSTLSELAPDSAAGQQGRSKTLYVDQWNLVRHRLGAVAAGRTARAIVLVTDPPPGEEEITGWIDDLRVGEVEHTRRDPVDHVRTTRGTHSGRHFSRGNCLPATAVPNGFNFWTPVTDAGSLSWPYHYQHGSLQAFALSHLPSPWIGDRNTFHVMPGTGPLRTRRRDRALPFSHAGETDRPHHYGVRFDCGITTDIAPTDHGAIMRFTFPAGQGWLLFDNVRNFGKVNIDTARRTVTGHTWVRSRSSAGTHKMYLHATFDQAPLAGRRLRRPPWRTVTGYATFAEHEVTMRIATSLISAAQARRNLETELAPPLTFDDVRDRARGRWQDLLGRVEVEGATEDQLRTLYSNLYRLFLYPNRAEEDTPHGTRHASPVARRRLRPGVRVFEGPMSVNHGFWDTYRTAWPAYALLAPSLCGRLLEGFVNQYREGGWISRWSCPGYGLSMVGTGSDVAFADAYLKGVRGFDVRAAYDAAVKNATVTPSSPRVGRRGLSQSIFLGFTPTSVREGLSWSLEGCVNDFGLANWSLALQEADNAAYFGSRAQGYVEHFDHRIGFFQGRTPRGDWRWTPQDYDPTVWGYDYTETNGWNAAFAVPHDGEGLAALHGGRAGLKAALDTFFATPETGTRTGSYRWVKHEMTEARDVRLGQYGHSNQPSHHIPYLYAHAGAPARTQRIVREVLRRCYLGSEIGQGYPGDEDNGEMSAWYLFGALGFYPLAVGSPRYVIGSPLFTRAVVHLENGNDIVINAPGNSAENVYVQSLHVNGQPHDSPWLDHDVLTAGAVLDFELGPSPSAWGTVGGPTHRPHPLKEIPGTVSCCDGTNVTALTDDSTFTEVAFRTAYPVLRHDGEATVRMYTLTSGSTQGTPSGWVLEGSPDGLEWTVLDERHDEVFQWRRQTRAFRITEPRHCRRHRLRITETTWPRLRLAQWELLS